MAHAEHIDAREERDARAPKPWTAPPQTWSQLDRLLARAGRGLDDRIRVRDGHRLASRIFSGWYRPSGRPFLAHAVGTAGVLAELGADCDAILAGLLHAAYAVGDFGRGVPGADPDAREQVRRVVGSAIEGRIHDYADRRWEPELLAKEGPGSDAERYFVLLRLANELEEGLSGGLPYSTKGAALIADRDARGAMLALARRIGEPRLAVALDETWRGLETFELPTELRSGRSRSYFEPPASHGLRPRAAWQRARTRSSRMRRRLSKRVGRRMRRGRRQAIRALRRARASLRAGWRQLS